MPNCSARRARSSRIFHLITDNLRGGAAGVFFARAEQVGVIALPLVADQLLQLFEGEAGHAGEMAFALAAEQGQVAGGARARADLPLPLLPTNAQLSPAATLRWSILRSLYRSGETCLAKFAMMT